MRQKGNRGSINSGQVESPTLSGGALRCQLNIFTFFGGLPVRFAESAEDA
jgi:hypothetical protein